MNTFHKIFTDKKSYLIGLFFAFVIGFTYNKWFFNFNPLTFTDWGYFLNRTLSTLRIDYFNVWSNDHSFGRVLLDVSQAPTYVIPGLLNYIFGISFALSERIMYFWPIAVFTPLGAYLLTKKVLPGSRLAATVGALVYSLNVPFLLIQTSQMTIMAAFMLAPFCLLAILKLLKIPNMKNSVIAALLMSLQSFYEFRVTYITLWLILFVIIFVLSTNRKEMNRKRVIIFVIISFALFALLNAFWVIGLSKMGAVTNNALFNRDVFGNQYLNLNQAITLFHPYWTGGAPKIFTVQPIPYYHWAIPTLGALGLYLNRKNKFVLMFALILLLGILLTKQADNPFTGLYSWLYHNFPGFNAYREASKFYFLIALGYSVLLASLVRYIDLNKAALIKNQYIAILSATLVLILFLFIPNGIKSGTSVTGNFEPKTVPSDYKTFESWLNKQPEFSRTVWTPITSRWGLYTSTHPSASVTELNSTVFQKLYPSTNIDQGNYLNIPTTLNNPVSKLLYGSGSVKYFIIPIRDNVNEDDFYGSYGDDRNYYIDMLNKIPWLKQIDIGTKQLRIYENMNFKPYITTDTQIDQIGDLSNSQNYYEFNKVTRGKDLNFTSNNSSRTSDTTQDLFENLQNSDLQKNHIDTTHYVSPSNTNYLYANDQSSILSFITTSESIKFESTNENITAVNGKSVGKSNTHPVAEALNDNSNSYVFSVGEKLYNLDSKTATTRTIGQVNDLVNLFTTTKINLVPNGSFEQGLWQKKVEDCNNYDNNGIINMNSTTDFSSEGSKSLVLSGKKHTACSTSSSIPVSEGHSYSLGYEYQIKDGQKAGYDLIFDNTAKSEISSDQLQNNGQRSAINTLFTAPSGAHSVKIRLKGYSNNANGTYSRTYYDNVRIHELSLVTNVSKKVTTQYQKTDMGKSNKIVASSSSAHYSLKNLIPNPSLEKGLWKDKVSDCNSFDKRPAIGMKLSSSSKSDGKQSLELSASRHIACTGPAAIKVKEGSSYLFSFDYQSPNSSQAGYYIGFNDASGTSISERLDLKDTEWQHFSKEIHIPFGATELRLSVYGYSGNSESDRQINRYDNFNLNNIPYLSNRYYLVSQSKQQLVKPRTVKSNSIGPTMKSIAVTGATTGFYLNMSESYNTGWRLELDDAKLAGIKSWLPNAKPTAVAASDHFNLNGFLNSWYVDPAKLCTQASSACKKNSDGSYDMELVAEFTPQRYFYVGLIISGLTLTGCITYLVVTAVRRRGQVSGEPPVMPLGKAKTKLLGKLARVAESKQRSQHDSSRRPKVNK